MHCTIVLMAAILAELKGSSVAASMRQPSEKTVCVCGIVIILNFLPQSTSTTSSWPQLLERAISVSRTLFVSSAHWLYWSVEVKPTSKPAIRSLPDMVERRDDGCFDIILVLRVVLIDPMTTHDVTASIIIVQAWVRHKDITRHPWKILPRGDTTVHFKATDTCSSMGVIIIVVIHPPPGAGWQSQLELGCNNRSS